MASAILSSFLGDDAGARSLKVLLRYTRSIAHAYARVCTHMSFLSMNVSSSFTRVCMNADTTAAVLDFLPLSYLSCL